MINVETTGQATNAAIGNDAKVLSEIHLASKNIAILQRDLSALNDMLLSLKERPVGLKANGTVEEITTSLKKYFDEELNGYTLILNDIVNVLSLFENLTQSSSFRLLLTIVDTDMCRRFHTDINHLRLLCTYTGQGTLWLPDEAVNIKALKSRNTELEIAKDKNQIQQAGAGDVVILKGALHPEGNAVVHRSPTIESSGEKRLLLRIDTNSFLNFGL